MLAHYHGHVWNAAELARSMDVSPTAVNRYRDLLAGTFMVRVLPPWFENLGKRLVKSPKVYLRDSGILHYLLGIEAPEELPMHPRYGASWEGFALEQTLIAHGAYEAYFYATQRGAELDLMLLRRGRRWGFEFKCTDAPRTTKAMHIAIDDLGLEHLWIVYPGSVRYPLTDRITALPLVEVNEIVFRSRNAPSVVSREFWHFLSSPCASMQAPQSRPGASLSLRPGAASGPATPTPDGTSPAGRCASSGPCSVRGVVRREYRPYWQGPQRGSLLARGALALPADGSGAHGELPKGASRGARGETPRMWIGPCGRVAPLGNGPTIPCGDAPPPRLRGAATRPRGAR